MLLARHFDLKYVLGVPGARPAVVARYARSVPPWPWHATAYLQSLCWPAKSIMDKTEFKKIKILLRSILMNLNFFKFRFIHD